jgi:dienelactone hydrolase
MRHSLTIIAVILLTHSVGRAFEPGRETEMEWPELSNPLRVYLPSNYSEDRLWPVVFHYHGTGGRPTTDIPKEYTGGRDFVIVGMEYRVTTALPKGVRDYLDAEIALLREVRMKLAAEIRIDPKRTYVGGFSQGGWYASELAEKDMADFAGAYILGAGKRKPDKRRTIPTGKKPIYIGVGQLDPNYFYGVDAIKHFRELGASVTFDEFLAMDHHMPVGRSLTPAFVQWWKIEAAIGNGTSLRAEADGWIDARLARAGERKSPMDRFLVLEHARKTPFASICSKEAGARLTAAFDAAAANPELKKEMAARKRYLAIVTAETNGAVGMEALRKNIVDYDALNRSEPDSWYGRRAAQEVARIRRQILDFGSWKWPDEAARQKVAADLEANPPPELAKEDPTAEFRRVRDLLAGM